MSMSRTSILAGARGRVGRLRSLELEWRGDKRMSLMLEGVEGHTGGTWGGALRRMLSGNDEEEDDVSDEGIRRSCTPKRYYIDIATASNTAKTDREVE